LTAADTGDKVIKGTASQYSCELGINPEGEGFTCAGILVVTCKKNAIK
jgi:hypothetical protein